MAQFTFTGSPVPFNQAGIVPGTPFQQAGTGVIWMLVQNPQDLPAPSAGYSWVVCVSIQGTNPGVAVGFISQFPDSFGVIVGTPVVEVVV